MVVGADATHDPAVLIPAYDDAQGVTAAFNKNLLVRINRELDGDFSAQRLPPRGALRRRSTSASRCTWSASTPSASRCSASASASRPASRSTPRTRTSTACVKFQALARRAGWTQRQLWMDAQSRFALHVLERVR